MAKKPHSRWDEDDPPAGAKEHVGAKEGEEIVPEPLVLPQTALVTSICQVWPIPGEPQLEFGVQTEVTLEQAKLWREMGYIA